MYSPSGSFSGFTQPRLSPASAGEAPSGPSSALELVPVEPARHQVVGRRHRAPRRARRRRGGSRTRPRPRRRRARRRREARRRAARRAEHLERRQLAGEQRGDVAGLLGIARAEHDHVAGPTRGPPAARTHGPGRARTRRPSACRPPRRSASCGRRRRRRARRRTPRPAAAPASRSPASAPGTSVQQPPSTSGRPPAATASRTAAAHGLRDGQRRRRSRSRRSRRRARRRGSAASRSPRSLAPRRSTSPRSRTAAGASSVPPDRPTESIGTPNAAQSARIAGLPGQHDPRGLPAEHPWLDRDDLAALRPREQRVGRLEPASCSRCLIVGNTSWSSPRRPASSAAAGVCQPSATISPPSGRGSWPGGAGARKKWVSKRIRICAGVIQRENRTSAAGSGSVSPASSATSRTAAARCAAVGPPGRRRRRRPPRRGTPTRRP